ncbi:leucine-rich_repeat domain-containing protein [Hexamita inflata]|uniref:Leucine-rich repeat domain-containing protein n=1 Tax=Hexamita inflata TaxID=28002 RepID=A0AA86QTN9_9EUKA|nr:leucine-rich repeat domain-containing protein [Hexamita inflata]
MTQQNLNEPNQEYDKQMIFKYFGQIHDGKLYIGDWRNGDPEVTNLSFVEQFNIQKLRIFVSNGMNVKFRSYTIKKLTLSIVQEQKQFKYIIVDDLELDNLEVLLLCYNNLENDQLWNLAKFKKLRHLDVSNNNVDLKHIYNVTSITTLQMQRCELKDIIQIGSLTNLNVLNVSINQLQKIDQICLLVNLKELYISQNKGLDIAPLKHLLGLTHLAINECDITQLSALQPLINLQELSLANNSDINISELQFLKNLTHLTLEQCKIVSIYVLRPLELRKSKY